MLIALLTVAHAQTFTPEVATALPHVDDVAVAPDGEQVAYVLVTPRDLDEPPGKPHQAVWTVPLGNGPARPLSRPGVRVTDAAWSPSGDRLAYLGTAEGDDEAKAQIHLVPLGEGTARVLTERGESVTRIAWSPDGERIAFVARPDPTEQEQADEEAGRDWTVIGEDRRPAAAWLLDLDSGRVAQAWDADLAVRDLAWLPDGSGLVVQATERRGPDADLLDRRLYRVPLEGAPRLLAETPGKLGPMAVAPGGDRLAILAATSRNDPLAQTVHLVDLEDDGLHAVPSDAERSARDLAWAGDDTLLVLWDQGTRSLVERIDLGRDRRRTVADLPAAKTVDLAGDTVAAVASTADHPSEVFAGTLRRGLERRTTHAGDLDLAERDTVSWTSGDERVQGVVTLPAGEGPSPLVVNPHGGPEGVSREGWDPLAQLLAARGFAVLQPNYRGSGGRGVAWSKGDHDDLGGAEFDDVLAGIDHLVERGVADPDRVGITGWSYGGYFTAWGLAKHEHRFQAAVMGAGIANWISFSGTTDIPHEMALVHWNSFWYDEPELHWERSPVRWVDGEEPPTLILHGADDPRVPPGQARELHQALQDAGVTSQLVLYPRAAHGLQERAHQIDRYQRTLGWFEEHLTATP